MTEQGDAQERYEKARAALGDVRLRRVDPRRMGAALLQVLDLHKPQDDRLWHCPVIDDDFGTHEHREGLCWDSADLCQVCVIGTNRWPCDSAKAVLSALEPS